MKVETRYAKNKFKPQKPLDPQIKLIYRRTLALVTRSGLRLSSRIDFVHFRLKQAQGNMGWIRYLDGMGSESKDILYIPWHLVVFGTIARKIVSVTCIQRRWPHGSNHSACSMGSKSRQMFWNSITSDMNGSQALTVLCFLLVCFSNAKAWIHETNLFLKVLWQISDQSIYMLHSNFTYMQLLYIYTL